MARVYKIEPSGNTIINQSPNAPQNDRGALGEVITSLGKTGAEISEKIRQAASLHEKTKAQNYLDSTLNEIKARAAQDNNISEDNVRKYDEEVDKAVADASGLMTIPAEREYIYNEFLGKSEIGKTAIRNDFVSKSIKLGAEELNIYEENKKNEWIQARSPKDKQRVELEMDTKINEALEANYIEPAEALKKRDSMKKEWAKAQVEYDITQDPTLAKELLEKGAYDNINQTDKAALLKKAQTGINEEKRMVEEEAQTALFNRELTLDRIAQIEPFVGGKTANTLKRALLQQQGEDVKQIKDDNESAKEYVDLVDSLISDQFDSFNFKRKLVEVFAYGSVDEDEAKVMTSIKEKLQMLGQKNFKAKVELMHPAFTIKYAFDKVKEWHAKNLPDDTEIMESLREIIGYDSELNKTEEDMTSFTDQLIRRQQQKVNPNAGKYYLKQVIQTDRGGLEVVGFDEDGEPLVRWSK